MATEAAIREQAVNYVAGELSLDAFDEWFAQATWNMHQDSDEAAQRLADAIELRLAEHTSAPQLTDEWLRNELAKVLAEYSVKVYLGIDPTASTTTVSTATEVPIPALLAA